MKRCIFIILFFVCFNFSVFGEISPNMNLQGFIRSQAGTPVDGNFKILFSFYNSKDAVNSICSELYNSVAVQKGVFSVILGNNGCNFSNVFNNTSSLWIGVKIENDNELLRQQINSVGYAFKAENADKAKALECSNCIIPSMVEFPWAQSDKEGGDALLAKGLNCIGCVKIENISSDAIDTGKIKDGTIKSTDLQLAGVDGVDSLYVNASGDKMTGALEINVPYNTVSPFLISNHNFIVDKTSNVGIGTKAPVTKLEVVSDLDTVKLGTIGSEQIVGGRNGGSFGVAAGSWTNGNLIIKPYSNGALYLNYGGGSGGIKIFDGSTSNQIVTIQSSGNIGIGSINPNYAIQINRDSGLAISNSNNYAPWIFKPESAIDNDLIIQGDWDDIKVKLDHDSTLNTQAQFQIYWGQGETLVHEFDGAGNAFHLGNLKANSLCLGNICKNQWDSSLYNKSSIKKIIVYSGGATWFAGRVYVSENEYDTSGCAAKRGLNVVVFSSKLNFKWKSTYDTYGNCYTGANESGRFVQDLRGLNSDKPILGGDIVTIYTEDEFTSNLSEDAKKVLRAIGCKKIADLGTSVDGGQSGGTWRSSGACIGIIPKNISKIPNWWNTYNWSHIDDWKPSAYNFNANGQIFQTSNASVSAYYDTEKEIFVEK